MKFKKTTRNILIYDDKLGFNFGKASFLCIFQFTQPLAWGVCIDFPELYTAFNAQKIRKKQIVRVVVENEAVGEHSTFKIHIDPSAP